MDRYIFHKDSEAARFCDAQCLELGLAWGSSVVRGRLGGVDEAESCQPIQSRIAALRIS